jgi:hypothetical protein
MKEADWLHIPDRGVAVSLVRGWQSQCFWIKENVHLLKETEKCSTVVKPLRELKCRIMSVIDKTMEGLQSNMKNKIYRFVTTVYTILDIINRPVFYLKLNSTLQVCPYLTGNTLRLRYEPNRLMLFIGL